jgi:biotin carboxyl carrier protein
MDVIAEQNHPSDQEIIIHEILVSVGQNVESNAALLIAEGSKSLFDVESSKAGIVREILVKSGDIVAVGTVLMILD